MSSQLILQKFHKISSVMINRSYITVSNLPAISSSRVLKTFVPVSSQVRTFWESFPYTRPLFYEKDGLNRRDFELIYHSSLFNYAFYSQLVSLFVFSTQIFGGSYYAYKSYVAGKVVPSITKFGPFVVNYDLLTIILLGVFSLQNFALYAVSQLAVLRIYYNETTEEFVIVTLAKNPFKSQCLFCKPGELIYLKDSYVEFLFGNHELDGKRLFIRYDSFKNMYYYNKLIGDNYE